MQAHACLTVAATLCGATRISRLRSDPPMVLRPIMAGGSEPGWNLPGAARVSLASSAAGPVGGDQLQLDIDVGSGAGLVLRTVAATLALPGPHGFGSHTRTRIRVHEGATLVWLPEPVIAARGCDHRATTHIELATDARLLAREELILGRHGEPSGTIHQRLRVTQGGHPLHDQDLCFGDPVPGWDSSAVTGGRKVLGSTLVVDPVQDISTEQQPSVDTDVGVLPLAGDATLVTALADDTVALRRRVDAHTTFHESE